MMIDEKAAVLLEAQLLEVPQAFTPGWLAAGEGDGGLQQLLGRGAEGAGFGELF
jgi:hypothetical protein